MPFAGIVCRSILSRVSYRTYPIRAYPTLPSFLSHGGSRCTSVAGQSVLRGTNLNRSKLTMRHAETFAALLAKSDVFSIVAKRSTATTRDGGMLTPKFGTVNLNSVRGILADATVEAKDGTRKSLLGVLCTVYGVDYRTLNLRTGKPAGDDSADDLLAEILGDHLVPAIRAKFPTLKWDAPVTRSVKIRPTVDLSDIL